VNYLKKIEISRHKYSEPDVFLPTIQDLPYSLASAEPNLPSPPPPPLFLINKKICGGHFPHVQSRAADSAKHKGGALRDLFSLRKKTGQEVNKK
jgi:hypothetical protein